MARPHNFWKENGDVQLVKYESSNSNDEPPRLKDERSLYACCDGNLNFAAAVCSEDDSEYGPLCKKNKISRQDPMSHRIIEKRRRDRMNNCLADLSRLIPPEYLKKGRGRIEKTEIIEMAIKHMKYLQQLQSNPSEHYRLGYQECMSETMRFLVEVEGHFPREAICVRLLNHLQKHCETLSPVKEPPPEPTPPKPVITDVIQQCVPEYRVDKQVTYLEQTNDVQFNFDKHPDNASYKYKTDIKLRFNQDLNAAKRKRKESSRRNSYTSTEHQSSSHSPPSSETRGSESDVIPEMSPPSHIRNEFSKSAHRNGSGKAEVKSNFNVPVFVLHAKGSFYVPLTIDYYTLSPFLQNCNLLDSLPNVLHPVTINVNFQQTLGVHYKSEYVPDWR